MPARPWDVPASALPVTIARSTLSRAPHVDTQTDDIREFLAAVLRGESPAWPANTGPDGARVLEAARAHHVEILAALQIHRGDHAVADWPTAVRDALLFERRTRALTEEIMRRELARVLAALDDAGLRPVLFKGAALAFTHYPDPAARPRLDADVLIGAAEVDRATRTLEDLGYRHPPAASGRLLAYQKAYARSDQYGVVHAVDVHWRISNRQRFARLPSAADLRAGAVAVPQLGPAARAADPAWALLIACVHRVAHHHGDERLIWLYDIHLLAEALGPHEREAFLSRAADCDCVAACERGLRLAHALFATAGAPRLLERLARHPGERDDPPVFAGAGTGARMVDDLVSDLRALRSWRDRARLLREHLVPPASYMRQKYHGRHPALLPALYAWRAASGAWRWIGGRRGPDRRP